MYLNSASEVRLSATSQDSLPSGVWHVWPRFSWLGNKASLLKHPWIGSENSSVFGKKAITAKIVANIINKAAVHSISNLDPKAEKLDKSAALESIEVKIKSATLRL